jgi:flavin-binding protein dodecin
VTETAITIKNIKAVHVKRCIGKIKNNKIVEYNVNVKIVFVMDQKEAM